MAQIKKDTNVTTPYPKALDHIDVTFHEHLSYFVAHTSPSLQGERGSEEKNFCFEEDKEELRQLIDQHIPVDWSSSNGEESDEDLVLEVTHDVSEMTNDVFEEQLQNTTPPALPSSQSTCDEEALEISALESYTGNNKGTAPASVDVVEHPPESKIELLLLSPRETLRYLNRLKESEEAATLPAHGEASSFWSTSSALNAPQSESKRIGQGDVQDET
ncbi:hypothetical protein L3X38_001949 [Prunus dulcis]|uniref:Uncharacterized protein n=1 Tax=Prunus dulcis TaxID=3755 RepID=A0AAD4WV14_PRUDU|nr:hypothetical protein L3X38_001949 [Prunus dulcis]